jgi:hypothetical protein
MMHWVQSENLGLLMMLVVVVIGGLAIYRLIVWVRAAPLKPDPWSAELETELQGSGGVPVCHHCFTPCPPRGWFCENCGCAVGPYNNWMPFVNIFSEGEVFRNGVADKIRASPLTVAGYLLSSLSNYLVFAPVYWYFLFKNLKRFRAETGPTELGQNEAE